VSSVYWLARSGITVAGNTPRRIRNAVASTVTSASYLGWRSKRRVTQQNMARVMGLPVTDARVRRAALGSWSNYGVTAAHLICLPYENIGDIDARTLDMSQGATWQEHAHKAMAAGKGMIITTGHFGSWDLAGAIAARYFPLSAIADALSKDPRLDALLQGHRREKSVSIIPVSGAARRVLHELDDRRAVAIVVDRPVPREQGVEVTFFGERTYVPGGSAAFAVRSGAAILPGYVWFAPNNRYYIRAFPPMFPRQVSNGKERQAEIQRLTQYMLDCQEEVVRQFPTQWFMFRQFWPTRDELAADEPSDEAGRQTSSMHTAQRTHQG
jgi:KDO2-lipid IV(A) lauroyltransferase